MFEVRTPRDVHDEIWNGPAPSLLEGLFTTAIVILVILSSRFANDFSIYSKEGVISELSKQQYRR